MISKEAKETIRAREQLLQHVEMFRQCQCLKTQHHQQKHSAVSGLKRGSRGKKTIEETDGDGSMRSRQTDSRKPIELSRITMICPRQEVDLCSVGSRQTCVSKQIHLLGSQSESRQENIIPPSPKPKTIPRPSLSA